MNDNIDEEILEVISIEPFSGIIANDYFEAGQQTTDYYCHNCGNKYQELRASRYGYPRKACPTCGKSTIYTTKRLQSSNLKLYVRETENGFDFAIFRSIYQFPDVTDWHDKAPQAEIEVEYVGTFDIVNGWFVYDSNSNSIPCKRNSSAETNILNKLTTLTPENVTKTNWFDLLQLYQDYKTQDEVERETKRVKSKSNLVQEMKEKFKPKEIDESQMIEKHNVILADLYSQKDGETITLRHCTKCGHEFQHVNNHNNDVITCPNCGLESKDRYSYYRNSDSCVIVLFENTKLPDNDLLIRVFGVEKRFSIKDGYQEAVWEAVRIFAGKKLAVFVKENANPFRCYGAPSEEFSKATIRDIPSILRNPNYYRNECKYVVQTDDEIGNIVKNSCLSRSGMIEAYGIGDERYQIYEKAPDLSYLMAWYKNPAIELVLKANLTELVNYYINNIETLGRGNTLSDVLCVEPSVVKMFLKLKSKNKQCTNESLNDLSALYGADNTMSVDTYNNIKESGLDIHNLAILRREYEIPFIKTIDYVENVYNHQCIEKRDALNIWIDYLRMAKALKINLKDKSRLYPNSLKKEHDVAMFAYRAIKAEVDQAQFKAQAEKNAYYEYSYKELMVVIPRTPEQIIEEATKQKNCLRSYVESVKRGDTVVAFVRRKETPDETYITAEIRNGRLNQLKGYCNSNPRNKEINEFVTHWSRAKGFRISC